MKGANTPFVMIKQTAITILGAAALSVSAQAESSACAGCFDYELSAGVHSEYIWRGVDQGGGQLVDTSFTATTEYNGTTIFANLWYATTGNGGLDELDVTLGWEREIAYDLTLSGGAIHYNFPDTGANTTELYLGVSRDLFAGISGSFTYYKDVDANDNLDGYIELGLSKDLEFFGSFTPTFDVTVGYDVEQDVFTHYQATLSTSYTLGKDATVSPYLSYSKGDSTVGSFGATSDEFIGGVSVAVSF